MPSRKWTVNELRRLGVVKCSGCAGQGCGMHPGPCPQCGGRRYVPSSNLSLEDAEKAAAIIDQIAAAQ